MDMEDETYIYRKEKTISLTEDGEEETRNVVMFGMTPEYIEFREDDETKKIEFDSIVKMYHGRRPDPERLHLVTKDGEKDLPKWILDEFEDVPEKISEYAGLTKTKGPNLEKTRLDELKNYADVGFKIFFLALVALMIGGAVLMFLISPCCFAPLSAIGVFGMIWLGFEIFEEKEVDERIWEDKNDYQRSS